MPNRKTDSQQKQLEAAFKQIRKMDESIGVVVESPEVAQNLIKLTLEQMHEGVQLIDHEYRYVYLNDAASKHGGLSRWDLLGKPMLECFPQLVGTDFWKVLERVMTQRRSEQMENFFERKDGSKTWYELHLEPHTIGVLIRSIDITSRKKVQEEYMHAQKMESIGRLAGGIAHDFNNKLGILTLYCEMAQNKFSTAPERIPDYLRKMQVAIQQATSLTKQLLAFSRKQVLDLKVSNLNELLIGTRSAIEKMVGENITLEYFLDKKLGNVRVDASQMDQVLLNLCINARDAMPKGGTITIETKNAELDEAYCKNHSEVHPGKYVMLSLSDNGAGMTEEVQKRLFEPFFTTKPKGLGTGLGLSMVHGIVRQSFGHIWVYSEEGMGSTFKLYFPLVTDEKETGADNSGLVAAVAGIETILLVEDDALLREAFEHALKGAGYTVFVAEDAEKGRELFDKNKEKIHMLLTDVILPKKNGKVLSDDLRKIRPDLLVAFVSGYTENSIVHHGILDTESVLIQKPVSAEVLLSVVRQILDGKLKKGVF